MRGYRELVFEGHLPVVKAFLMGVKVGKGWATASIICEEWHVQRESFGHKLLEKLRVETDLTHVLVPERHVATIIEAVRATRSELGLVIRRNRGIRQAHFSYRFSALSRQVAARMKRVLRELPGTLERKSDEEREIVRPEGHGVEGYAPEHEFEFKGAGTVLGPIDDLLVFRQRLDRMEWVQVSDISLVLG